MNQGTVVCEETNAPGAASLAPLFGKSAAVRLVAIFLVLLVVGESVYIARIGNNVGIYSDPHSEADTLRSMAAYHRDGIWSHHGMPRILYHYREIFPNHGTVADHVDANGKVPEKFREGFPSSMSDPDQWIYTHYPPLPNLLCGLMAKLVGAGRIWALRILPATISLIAVIFLFRSLMLVFGPDRGALMGIACSIAPLILSYFPALHYEGYSLALFYMEAGVLVRMFWGTGNHHFAAYLGLFFLGLFQGSDNYDFCFIVVFFAIPLWMIRRAESKAPPFSRLILAVFVTGMGFALAQVLHVMHAALDIGLKVAFDESRRTAVERAGQTGYDRLTPIQMYAKASYLTLRETLNPRNLHYGPLLIGVLFLSLPLLFGRRLKFPLPDSKSGDRRVLVFGWNGVRGILVPVLWALFVSAIWLLLMPQHVAYNSHVTVHHFILLYFCLVVVLFQSLNVERSRPPDASVV